MAARGESEIQVERSGGEGASGEKESPVVRPPERERRGGDDGDGGGSSVHGC